MTVLALILACALPLVAATTPAARDDALPAAAHAGLDWDARRRTPSPLGLHGRVQLIVFHQDDEQENRTWPQLLAQVAAAWGGEPRVALIAVGVGGTGIAYAGPEWLVARDPGRHLVRAYTTAAVPNRYCIVDGDGAIVETGNAHAHRKLPTGQEFHLARSKRIAALLATATPPWPSAVLRSSETAETMDALRAGDLIGGLRLAKAAGDGGRPLFDGVLAQRAALVAADAALLADPRRGSLRFLAWQRLAAVAEDLKGSAPGDAALAALTATRYEALDQERAAWTAWTTLLADLRVVPAMRQVAFRDERLARLLAQHSGTYAADLAVNARPQP